MGGYALLLVLSSTRDLSVQLQRNSFETTCSTHNSVATPKLNGGTKEDLLGGNSSPILVSHLMHYAQPCKQVDHYTQQAHSKVI